VKYFTFLERQCPAVGKNSDPIWKKEEFGFLV